MGGWPGSRRWDEEISEEINGMNGWIFGIHMSLLQHAPSPVAGCEGRVMVAGNEVSWLMKSRQAVPVQYR